MMAKKVQLAKLLFLSRPNESVGKTHRAEQNQSKVISTINNKTHQFHMIKNNKEVALKTRDNYFLYRKPQKLKFAKHLFFW